MPRSSPRDAAIAPTPTGPPPNFSMIVARMRRSSSSNPCSSTSRRASAWRAVSRSISSLWATSAKSRSRRRRRLAMRGVPRLRAPISRAASGAIADRQDARRAVHDLRQRGDVVEVQAQRDAEAAVQRLGEQARARRRADQREGRQVHLHRARHRPFADEDVEPEVLHRRVEDLLDRGREAVDLVHEQDVAGLEVRQDAGQVARARDHRPRGQAQARAHLPRDDVRERRLAETRRPRQQNVVEGLAAALRGGEKDREVLADLRLPDVFAEVLRPQLRLDGGVVLERGPGEDFL